MGWEKISTIGATAGTDLKESDGTVLADNAIRNEDLSISQGNSGVLTLNRGAVAADRTTITKAKLNLCYDDGATVGATWGTNVGSRPTELTDGRISTALTATGILDTTVPEAKGGTGLTSAGNAIKNNQITRTKNEKSTSILSEFFYFIWNCKNFICRI